MNIYIKKKIKIKLSKTLIFSFSIKCCLGYFQIENKCEGMYGLLSIY